MFTKIYDYKSIPNSQFWGEILIMSFWVTYPILDFFSVFLSKVLPIEPSTFVTIYFTLLTCCSVQYWRSTIKSKDVLFFLILILVYFSTIVLFPNNEKDIVRLSGRFVIECLPIYFLGLSFNEKRLAKILYHLSCICLLLEGFHFFVFLKELNLISAENNIQDMIVPAHLTVPHVLIVIKNIFNNKITIFNIGIIVLGLFILFSFGNRAALLLVCLFFITCLILYGNDLKIIILYTIPIFLLFVFWDSILENLSNVIGSFGLSNRIAYRIEEGVITDDNGRQNIYAKAFSALNDSGILGLGLTGDRPLFDGTYVHNVIIEFLIAFGYWCGPLLLLGLFLNYIRSYFFHSSLEQKVFFLIFFNLGFVKLLFSSSFLIEPFFYFLLGYCIRLQRKY